MRLIKAAILSCLSIGLWCTAAPAASIFEQAPCGSGNSPCDTITRETNFPRNLASVAFAVAGSGQAHVTLNGSMVCSSPVENTNSRVVDLVAQLVMAQNGVPEANGPGGARHAVVLLPSERGTSDTFNLAASRVVFVPPGQTVVHYNVSALRIDPNTSCAIYNLSFQVVYIER